MVELSQCFETGGFGHKTRVESANQGSDRLPELGTKIFNIRVVFLGINEYLTIFSYSLSITGIATVNGTQEKRRDIY